MTEQMLGLRPYQREAIDALRSDWSDGHQRLGLVLPTGSGKTVLFAHLIAEEHQQGRRAVVLVHRDELVNQAVDKLHQIAPHLSIGVVKAERDEVEADAVIASVQTLSRPGRAERLAGRVGLVVVDEVHHAAAATWRDTLERLGCFDPTTGIPMVGVTATMAREDNRSLGEIIEKISYTRDIVEMIQDKWLVPVRGRRIRVGGLDLDDVRVTSGDLAAGDLSDHLVDAGAGQVVARAYLEHASDRQGVLFAPTVASAHMFALELERSGVSAEPIWGNMPLEDRHDVLRRFAAGRIQVLSNAMILTEGWDAPYVSCAVIARPTMSATLYIQQVGRVLRPHPGKADALVLDIVGATANHKLRTLVDLSARTSGEVELDYGDDDEVDFLDIVETSYRERGKKGASGKLTYDEIDLFAASNSAWLQTRKGLWFVPTYSSIFFLFPEKDDTYKVVQRTRTGGYNRLNDGLSLSYAMSWAEQYANDEDADSPFSISGRQAAWRKKKAKPTERQIDKAKQAGVELTGDEHRAELSDMISVALASNKIDRWVK